MSDIYEDETEEAVEEDYTMYSDESFLELRNIIQSLYTSNNKEFNSLMKNAQSRTSDQQWDELLVLAGDAELAYIKEVFETSPKIYSGSTDETGKVIVTVQCGDEKSQVTELAASSRAIKKIPSLKHDLSQFSWGYLGSGPAALAHSILTDLFNESVADRFFQFFKEEVLINFKQPGFDNNMEYYWKLTGKLIAAWLHHKIISENKFYTRFYY